MSTPRKRTITEFWLSIQVPAAEWRKLSREDHVALKGAIVEMAKPLLESVRAAVEEKFATRGISAISEEG